MKKWFWITLGIVVGTHLIWYLYVFFFSVFFPVESDEMLILETSIFSVEVTVMCTVIILHKLNKLKK